MIEINTAFELIDEKTNRLGPEMVPTSEAVGRVLRQKVRADTDLPPFDRSQMDGYAVMASDTVNTPVKLRIAGESAAGRGWHRRLKTGEAVRIMTGAPVPKGADAVQRLEVAREVEMDGKGYVELLEPTTEGRYIVPRGSETRRGTTVFGIGQTVTENMVPALAAFGYSEVVVSSRPRVAVLGTGSEIVGIAEKPGRDQIRNSNSVMLEVLCRNSGASARTVPNVGDDVSLLKRLISRHTKKADLLVMTGGVSVGKYDHTKAALEELGARIFFEKVRLKPGKPAVFAQLGGSLVFGLPGNPVSAAVTFHLFVRRALRRMQGASDAGLRTGHAVLAADAKGTRERDTYLPSFVETDKNGKLVAVPLKWHGSSDLVGFAHANSLIFVPRDAKLGTGEIAQIVYL